MESARARAVRLLAACRAKTAEDLGVTARELAEWDECLLEMTSGEEEPDDLDDMVMDDIENALRATTG